MYSFFVFADMTVGIDAGGMGFDMDLAGDLLHHGVDPALIEKAVDQIDRYHEGKCHDKRCEHAYQNELCL